MDQTNNLLNQLRQKIEQHFDLNELRVLCHDLGIPWENLSGDNKPTKVISLISHVERRESLPKLLSVLQRERPTVHWFGVNEDKLLQSQPSSQSGNSINVRGGGTIKIGRGIIQEGDKNSVDADSEGVIEAEELTQRKTKK